LKLLKTVEKKKVKVKRLINAKIYTQAMLIISRKGSCILKLSKVPRKHCGDRALAFGTSTG
jgi:hypothetical protein